MGRVDEAIRRAAATAVETPIDSGQPAYVPSDESFPAEMPDRRPLLQKTAAAPSAVFDPEPVVARIDPGPSASLFERLDARVAGKIVVDQNMLPASREQYRRLAAALHHAQGATGIKVVMIASAVAAEGKTLTSSNLALTLSESYHRSVLLIDADLRRPSLHTIFKISASPGLSEGLHAGGDGKLPVHQVSRTLTVLPAGQSTSDPMAGLTSPRMRQLIDEAKSEFDWVIIDTPPVGLLTDASLLASIVDGAILVVRAGETPFDLVQRAVQAIGASRLLGVVLNAATASGHGYGYKYYSRYDSVAAPTSR